MELGPVHHVSINVDDVEAAAPFYTDVLGMAVLPRPDFGFDGRWLRTPGGGEVHLIEVEGWVPPAGQHWAFKVDDIDAAVAQLRDRGVEVADPKPLPGTPARQDVLLRPGRQHDRTQPAGLSGSARGETRSTPRTGIELTAICLCRHVSLRTVLNYK